MAIKKKGSVLLLGFFIFLALFILVIAVFTIGNKEGLFRDNIIIYANFNSVEGIRRGATIRLSGVDIGVVTDIQITNDNKVNITMKINKDYQKFIHKTSEASIELEGLVGGKYVSLNYGTGPSENVENGDVIKTKDPFSLGKIMQEAQISVDNAAEMTKNLSMIFAKVNAGKGTIGKLVNDTKIYDVLLSATGYIDTTVRRAADQLGKMSSGYLNLTQSIDRIMNGVDSTVYNISNIINKVKYGEGTVWALFTRRDVYDSLLMVIKNTVETVQEAKLGASRFAENMEALKHNFLFKGYFEDRGYWDKVEFEKNLDLKIIEIKEREDALKKKEKELLEKEEEIKKLNIKN
jgi:phospholipid/cholesterol/gamma-HCH transport system substrate-binding protein